MRSLRKSNVNANRPLRKSNGDASALAYLHHAREKREAPRPLP
jgi:hypothetical protein